MGEGVAETRSVLLQGLNSPFGMALVGGLLTFVIQAFVAGYPELRNQVVESFQKIRSWLQQSAPFGLNPDKLLSSINGMLGVRGDPSDFDAWAASGCTGWDYAHVLPYFVRAETYERPGDPFRGTNGPQHVSHLRGIHPLTEEFIAAAMEAAAVTASSDLTGSSSAAKDRS